MGKHQNTRTKQIITEPLVTTYMKEVLINGAHRQRGCNDINLTSLAEDAADQFGITSEVIPEEFFDWSLAAAEWFEEQRAAEQINLARLCRRGNRLS